MPPQSGRYRNWEPVFGPDRDAQGSDPPAKSSGTNGDTGLMHTMFIGYPNALSGRLMSGHPSSWGTRYTVRERSISILPIPETGKFGFKIIDSSSSFASIMEGNQIAWIPCDSARIMGKSGISRSTIIGATAWS